MRQVRPAASQAGALPGCIETPCRWQPLICALALVIPAQCDYIGLHDALGEYKFPVKLTPGWTAKAIARLRALTEACIAEPEVTVAEFMEMTTEEEIRIGDEGGDMPPKDEL